ncbi:MAG: transcriptional regulator [Acidobacteria bacterium]|nr:MAG: transcriptional regulator [Acidobacteriota bacterium]
MPLYEYECKKCHHRFERIQKFSDRHIKKCPDCGGPVEQLISAPTVQFKGSGWYVTDYAKKSSSAGSSSSNGDSSGKKEDKKEGKSKSDKPETSSKSDGSSKSESSSNSESSSKSESSSRKSERKN